MNRDWLEKDFYATLGVSKDAASDVIKKKYRALARELHPDKNPGNASAEERFKLVSEAYDVLSDEAKRKEYDEARSLYATGGVGGQGGFPRGGSSYQPNVNLDDLFGGEAGGFSDLLGNIFTRNTRGGGRTSRAPKRGADLDSEITLSFNDALEGVTVPLRLASEAACDHCRGTGARAGTMPRVCPSCEGTGHTSRNAGGFAFTDPCQACRGRGLVVEDPCPTCQGSGRGMSARTVSARIPVGVKDGARIRLKGKGAPGERGGAAGDLYLTVHVASHPIFGRRDDHVTLTVPITFTEAVLGAEITVPTPQGGTVRIRIPEGTAGGRVFRVRGKGSTRKDGTRGDLMVTVDVEVPQRLSTEAREALESYAEATADHDPRRDLLTLAGQDHAGSS